MVFVKVVWRSGDGAVERVEESGVVRSKGEFVDYVREVECWVIEVSIQIERRDEAIEIRHTTMIQMLPKLPIAMPPRRNMKVPLDLIPLNTPINPTTSPLIPPPQSRRLPKLLLLPFDFPQHMPRMSILLQLRLHLAQIIKRVQASLYIDPLRPIGIIHFKQIPC